MGQIRPVVIQPTACLIAKADHDERLRSTLLITPICWEHYLLLLSVPVIVVARMSPPKKPDPLVVCFAAAGGAVMISPATVWPMFGVIGKTAQPWMSLTFISLQFYAMVAFLTVQLLC